MGQYSDMVKALAKPGEDIRNSLTDESWSILHVALEQGIAVGEELDIVKKQVVYEKDLGIVSSMAVPMTVPENLTPEKCHLLHMALGIFGEAAELLSAVLAHAKGGELDIENCIEEAGDSEFYWEGFRQGIGIDRTTILAHNTAKLSKRYHGGTYDNSHAQERADKT